MIMRFEEFADFLRKRCLGLALTCPLWKFEIRAIHLGDVVQNCALLFDLKRLVVVTRCLVLTLGDGFARMLWRVVINDVDRIRCFLKRCEPRRDFLCFNYLSDCVWEVVRCALGDEVNAFKRDSLSNGNVIRFCVMRYHAARGGFLNLCISEVLKINLVFGNVCKCILREISFHSSHEFFKRLEDFFGFGHAVTPFSLKSVPDICLELLNGFFCEQISRENVNSAI